MQLLPTTRRHDSKQNERGRGFPLSSFLCFSVAFPFIISLLFALFRLRKFACFSLLLGVFAVLFCSPIFVDPSRFLLVVPDLSNVRIRYSFGPQRDVVFTYWPRLSSTWIFFAHLSSLVSLVLLQ